MKCGFVALCAWTFFVILRLFPAYYYDSARSTYNRGSTRYGQIRPCEAQTERSGFSSYPQATFAPGTGPSWNSTIQSADLVDVTDLGTSKPTLVRLGDGSIHVQSALRR